MRPGVDGVLLDIDDTLVDTNGSFRSGMAAIVARYLPHLGESGADRALAHWHADADGVYRRFVTGELDFLQQRRLRAQAMHRDLGGPELDDAGFADWNDTYDEVFRAAWQPLDDAVALLAALEAEGVPFGAVTNHSTGYQTDKLERTGLSALKLLVGTDTLGVGKPEPRVFRHACELIGTEPSRTVYVGNDLTVDAEGALAAGLQAVWLDRGIDHRGVGEAAGRAPADGVVRVTDLAGVLAWLQLPGAPEGADSRVGPVAR
ncbi:HAD family hydrolase [Angustibacter aerolatus]